MSTPVAEGRVGGLIDRRLASRVAVTRRYLALAVLVGVLATASVVAQAVLLATIVERSLRHHVAVGTLVPQLVGLAAAFVARAACSWVGEVAAQRTSATVVTTLRRQLLAHALELGPGWLAGERAGELSLTATRGIGALDTYFGRYLPQAVLAGLVPLGVLAWVASQDWLSFLVLGGLAALVPVAMALFGRQASRRTRQQWRRLSSLAGRFLELLVGLPTLRAFGRTAQARREVAAATDGLREATIGTLRIAFLSALAMEFLAGVGTGLVAMVLGLRLLGGHVPLVTALAVLLVSPEVFLPLRRAGAEFHASAEGQAAAARILDVLDRPAPATGATTGTGGDGGGGGGDRSGEGGGGGGARSAHPAAIAIAGVTVCFAGRSAPALDRLDLTVEPGERVAVLGPSGAGKSTLLHLLLGFVPPDEGQVAIGGVALGTVAPRRWREQFTWVPQHPTLLRGTIADNLRIGDPRAGAGRLASAAAAAGLDPLLDQLALGLETPVGESGLDLSTGERQRLAIARAMLKDAPVVLLDEPMSHLDRETEAALRSSVDHWLADRTVLVAAHRPDAVPGIDRVVTLAADEPSAA
ncbi:MAG: thiol reductant ABC exporter subunit CydD, partial [Acidimicrobiales bacterium]